MITQFLHFAALQVDKSSNQICSENLMSIRACMYPAWLVPGAGDNPLNARTAGLLYKDLPAAEPPVGMIGWV